MKYNSNQPMKRQTKTLKFALLILLTCFLVSGPCLLQAAQIHPLNDLQVIEVPISQTGLTRITVQGDRIAGVFGIAGEYVTEVDETQGQVFIRPMEPAPHPVSITVTTEGGHTQDLRLIPQNKAPEALILTAGENKGSEDAQGFSAMSLTTAPTEPITRHEIEDLLYACMEGRIPVGYLSIPLQTPSTSDSYRLTREIANNKLRGLTYEVKNAGTIPWILSESEFVKDLLNIRVLNTHVLNTHVLGTNALDTHALDTHALDTHVLGTHVLDTHALGMPVLAILMPKKTLQPGESTHVFIAAQSL